jgi:hypothetical protein
MNVYEKSFTRFLLGLCVRIKHSLKNNITFYLFFLEKFDLDHLFFKDFVKFSLKNHMSK